MINKVNEYQVDLYHFLYSYLPSWLDANFLIFWFSTINCWLGLMGNGLSIFLHPDVLGFVENKDRFKKIHQIWLDWDNKTNVQTIIQHPKNPKYP